MNSTDTINREKNENRRAGVTDSIQDKRHSRIAATFQPMKRRPGLLTTAEELLKRPGGVLYEFTKGNQRPIVISLLSITILCLLAYGLTAGAFNGGIQLWAAPLKIASGMMVAAFICLPSLMVFTSLGGSETGVREICGLLIAVTAMISLLLVGLAPVSWIFSQSTSSVVFMGILHLLFWGVAVHHGLRLLRSALAFLDGKRAPGLSFWSIVFFLVSLQMMTTLRPIIGESERFLQAEKKFFIAHWFECMEGKGGELTPK